MAALRLSPEKLATLIDAVTAEFLDQGYRRASIDRIAAAVRVSKATIYRQFGNKEDLLRYIVRRDIFDASCSAFEPIPATADAEAALMALAGQALARHLAPANIRMHRLLVEEAGLIPDLARLFYEGRVRRLGMALAMLLATQGLPRPGHAAMRAFYTLATFGVRFFTEGAMPSVALQQAYARESAALFLHGLRS